MSFMTHIIHRLTRVVVAVVMNILNPEEERWDKITSNKTKLTQSEMGYCAVNNLVVQLGPEMQMTRLKRKRLMNRSSKTNKLRRKL
jgi:hypothetical protein